MAASPAIEAVRYYVCVSKSSVQKAVMRAKGAQFPQASQLVYYSGRYVPNLTAVLLNGVALKGFNPPAPCMQICTVSF